MSSVQKQVDNPITQNAVIEINGKIVYHIKAQNICPWRTPEKNKTWPKRRINKKTKNYARTTTAHITDS